MVAETAPLQQLLSASLRSLLGRLERSSDKRPLTRALATLLLGCGLERRPVIIYNLCVIL